MSKTIRYQGTQRRWSELAVTGKQSTWSPGWIDARDDLEASQLLATGFFAVVQDALSAAQVAATVNALTAHPGDWMRGVAGKQTSDIAAAISTTVVAAVAIPVASTKVRVAWIGRGSAGALAGTERLYLACNRPNDVAGLVRSQDPRSRQFTLAPDEAVMITSSVPITSIHFSASASISANFHAIRVNHEVSA